jgi:hypothetical protein
MKKSTERANLSITRKVFPDPPNVIVFLVDISIYVLSLRYSLQIIKAYGITFLRVCVSQLSTLECLSKSLWNLTRTYITAPEPNSTAYFINATQQSVCLYFYPPIITKKRLGIHVTAAANAYAAMKLIDVSHALPIVWKGNMRPISETIILEACEYFCKSRYL